MNEKLKELFTAYFECKNCKHTWSENYYKGDLIAWSREGIYLQSHKDLHSNSWRAFQNQNHSGYIICPVCNTYALVDLVRREIYVDETVKKIVKTEEVMPQGLLELLRSYKPDFVEKTSSGGSKFPQLRFKENATNHEVAALLSREGFKAHTEVSVGWNRVDILVNDFYIIEAKEDLLWKGRFNELLGSLNGLKDLSAYKVIVLVYGDAMDSYLLRLKEESLRPFELVLLGSVKESSKEYREENQEEE